MAIKYNPLLNSGFDFTGTSSGGSGNVIGPGSSTDNAVVRFDGTSGTSIQNSLAIIDDAGNLTATNFSGSSSGINTGDVTLTAVGSSPNANAASLTGQILNLQPANNTNPGVVSTGVQSFGGNKTFTGTISASNLSGTNSGDVTIGAPVGATTNGATITGQVLALASADTTHPGIVNFGVQSFGGLKTFSDGLIGQTYSTNSSQPANSGEIRLGNTDSINWRNAANNANFGISLNSSNIFTFGAPITVTGAIKSTSSLVLEDPGAGTNTVTIQSPTLAAGYTLTLPVDDGTPSQVLTTDGSGVLSWTTSGSSGANVTLSNLTSPTAINQDLLPGTANNNNIGSSTKTWIDGYFVGDVKANTISVRTGLNTPIIRLFADPQTTPSGASTPSIVNVATPGSSNTSLSIYTSSGTSASTGGALRIETGNNTAASGSSGTLALRTGDAGATSGNSGDISFNTGTAGGTRGVISLAGASINANTSQIHNVVDPTSAQDAATKNYVDTHSTSFTFNKENITLTPTNITNQFVDLAHLIKTSSLTLAVNKTYQVEGDDYTLSTVGGITRLTFSGDLATGGVSALVSTDILNIQYAF